ncbi:MAG: hypothetical protein OXC65_05025 [Thiotrichales bacterium]|nr:hypothetical protein [Thiotrichales bacterium]
MKDEDSIFGFSKEEWELGKKVARNAMLSAAVRERRDSLPNFTITYSELAPKINARATGFNLRAQDRRLYLMLDQISTEEHKAGRGMLSVVVVRKSDGRPGHKFFYLAKSLGHDTEDYEAFWQAELSKVHQAVLKYPHQATAIA